MATYAAYRHIELDHVGYGKKRVLKPPGGGTSDIFGSNDPGSDARRVKNHMASSVMLSDEPIPSTPTKMAAPSTGKTPNNRLFGPASPPKSTPRPNRNVSRIIPLDGEQILNGHGAVNGKHSPGKMSPPAVPVTNGDAHDGLEAPSSPNGNSTASSPIANGNRVANGGPAPTGPRQRVPPGGFSSGLW